MTNQKPAAFNIQIGGEDLSFRPVVISDPVPTGAQIVEAAGLKPVKDHLVFEYLPNGMLEELRHDETSDLREKGAERFVIFRSDRSFRFDLDDRVFEWGTAHIKGRVLKTLAGVDLATYGVWLEVRGQEDLLIEDDAEADLSLKGLERFFTGIVQTTEG